MGENKQFGQRAHIQTGLRFHNILHSDFPLKSEMLRGNQISTDYMSHLNLLHPLGLNVLACASVLLIFFRETYLIFSD